MSQVRIADLVKGNEYLIFDVDTKKWDLKAFVHNRGDKLLFEDGGQGYYNVMREDFTKCVRPKGGDNVTPPGQDIQTKSDEEEVEEETTKKAPKKKTTAKPKDVVGMEVSMDGLEGAKITLPKDGIIPITRNFKNGLDDIVAMGKVTHAKDGKLYVEFAAAELGVSGIIEERDGDKITKFDLRGVSLRAKK